MRRRQFITVLGGALAWPLFANAQQVNSVPRIGILTLAARTSSPENAFREGLRDFGYVEGKNLIVDFRFAAGKTEHLDTLAADLIATKPDLIFSAGSEATRAVRSRTSTIPIVMTSTNPVALGFVASLAQPGANITGLSIFGPETSAKRLELLKELVPGLTKVAVFWNPSDPGAKYSLKETQEAGKVLKEELLVRETRNPDDLESAFRAAANEGAGAVILVPAPLMSRNAKRIAAIAIETRLPTLFYSDEAVKVGGLISYGASLVEIYRRAAYFVDRILKGSRPGDIPVEQPTRFELAINLKTAKAFGVIVPPSLLTRADEVIE